MTAILEQRRQVQVAPSYEHRQRELQALKQVAPILEQLRQGQELQVAPTRDQLRQVLVALILAQLRRVHVAPNCG